MTKHLACQCMVNAWEKLPTYYVEDSFSYITMEDTHITVIENEFYLFENLISHNNDTMHSNICDICDMIYTKNKILPAFYFFHFTFWVFFRYLLVFTIQYYRKCKTGMIIFYAN